MRDVHAHIMSFLGDGGPTPSLALAELLSAPCGSVQSALLIHGGHQTVVLLTTQPMEWSESCSSLITLDSQPFFLVVPQRVSFTSSFDRRRSCQSLPLALLTRRLNGPDGIQSGSLARSGPSSAQVSSRPVN